MISPSRRPDLCQIGGQALVEVFDSCLSLSVTEVTRVPDAAVESDDPGIVGTVALIGEGVSGDVHLQFPVAFAEHVAGVLLGQESGDPLAAAAVDDFTGEVCNMVAGRVAAGLTQHGYLCSLGTPKVVRGAGLRRKPEPEIHRGRTEWSGLGHRITIEVHCHYRLT